MIINVYHSWGFLLQASYDTDPNRVAFSCEADHYSDFVVHCLNGNYDRLIYVDDGYERNLSILEDDLSRLELDIYKQIIEKIYIDKKYANLSPEHKYHAFMISKGIHPVQPKDRLSSLHAALPAFGEYNATIRISSEYTDDDIGQYAIRDEIDEARSIHNSDTVFDAICKIAADHTENYRIVDYNEFHNFSGVFAFLFREMIKDKIRIIKCRHCGKYFVPERAYSQYCDEMSPEDPKKTCQEYVRYNNYRNSQTEAAKLHKRIYNRLNNRWKRTVSNQMLKDEVDTFLIISEIKRKQAVKGEITEGQYIEWLKDIEADKIEIKPFTALYIKEVE